MNEQKVMAKTAYLALDEKKGEDICVIDISSISVMADYFVLASGMSTPQIQAMVDNVQDDRLFYDLERIWSDGRQIDPAALEE